MYGVRKVVNIQIGKVIKGRLALVVGFDMLRRGEGKIPSGREA